MANRVKHVTLVAATATTVTLTGYYKSLEVINLGDTAIYARTDGTNPTVKGDECDVIPPNSSLTVGGNTDWSQGSGATRPTSTSVRLISSGTPDVAISGGY